MNAARALHHARRRAKLTQRQLAAATGVAQPTIARIERGLEVPRVDTLDRLVRAAGFALEAGLGARPPAGDAAARARELVDALDLAAAFPAEHDAELRFPRFGAPA